MVKHASNRSRQQGMALVMGLIILLVMTLISISAMRSTLMQERMSGAFQGQQLAFQTAEAALRHAERQLSKASVPIGDPGYYERSNPNHNPPTWEEAGASIEEDKAVVYDKELANVARKPLFFVEKISSSCEQPDAEANTSIQENAFRIMVLGFGSTENSQVVLESYYCR